jgi:death-on-curing protein
MTSRNPSPENDGKSRSRPAESTAYGFGIARNHPFFDGNKRTAAVVCETFVDLNGHQLTADDEAMYLALVQLAEGSLSEEDLAEWIRSKS